MALTSLNYQERNYGRRLEDSFIRDTLQKYEQGLDVGCIVTSEMDLNTLIELIIEKKNELMETKRSTVFLYDEMSGELWSMMDTGNVT